MVATGPFPPEYLTHTVNVAGDKMAVHAGAGAHGALQIDGGADVEAVEIGALPGLLQQVKLQQPVAPARAHFGHREAAAIDGQASPTFMPRPHTRARTARRIEFLLGVMDSTQPLSSIIPVNMGLLRRSFWLFHAGDQQQIAAQPPPMDVAQADFAGERPRAVARHGGGRPAAPEDERSIEKHDALA